MSAREDFGLPDLPPGCLKCGRAKPVSLQKVTYRHTGGSGAVTALALLAGFLVSTQTTYMLKLPLCAACASYRRRKALVLLLMLPVVGGLFALSFRYGLEYPVLFALPVIFALVFLMFAAVMQMAATPKAVRLTGDTLVIDVPGHGHVTLAGPEPTAARAQAAPPPRKDAGPRLNRSVCGGCGFINFAGAVECKKCLAPLGEAATV